MSPAHIIWPKLQWEVVDTWAAGSMLSTHYLMLWDAAACYAMADHADNKCVKAEVAG